MEEELTFEEQIQQMRREERKQKDSKKKELIERKKKVQNAELEKKIAEKKSKPVDEEPKRKRDPSEPEEVSAKDRIIKSKVHEVKFPHAITEQLHKIKKIPSRDPRFGRFDQTALDRDSKLKVLKPGEQDYEFVYGMQEQELQLLKNKLRQLENERRSLNAQQEDDDEEDENLQAKLETVSSTIKLVQQKISQLTTSLHKYNQKKIGTQIVKEHYEKEVNKIKDGKKPYYMSHVLLNQKIKEKNFELLKNEGRLDKYMDRKRKRTKSKQSKLMIPSQNDSEQGPSQRRRI